MYYKPLVISGPIPARTEGILSRNMTRVRLLKVKLSFSSGVKVPIRIDNTVFEYKSDQMFSRSASVYHSKTHF